MGVSTDGQINYGFKLDYGEEQPWDEFGEDIQEWWENVKGYENPYTYPEQKDLYYKYLFDWRKKNPLPVELIDYCSDRHPMYILALAFDGLGLTANRGYPTSFEPSELVVTAEQRDQLIHFCSKYQVKVEGEEPKWWLSSYWG